VNNFLQNSPIPLKGILGEIKGGNSTVYRCLAEDSKIYAVKVLDGTKERRDSAILRQIAAAEALKGSAIHHPVLIGVNAQDALLVFEWIEGFHPISSKDLAREIIRVATALKEIHSQGSEFVLATDALQNFAIEITNIESRHISLQESFPEEVFKIWSTELLSRLDRIKQSHSDLQFELDTLSFSDFGSHNILESNDRYYFLDSEFFGSDSSYKLLADIILHPQNNFSLDTNLLLVDEISKIFHLEESKLRIVLLLLSLKWSTIAFKRFSTVSIKGMNQPSHELAMGYFTVFDKVAESELRGGLSAIHESLMNLRAR
jgi:hypothetical protein